MADGAAAPPALMQKVKASGFLWKKGHRVKNWKRRWFILRDAYLAYFEAPTKTNQAPKGVVPIGGCEISENAFTQTGFSHSFVLTTSIGVYMLRCDTKEEASDWLAKLKQSRTLFAGLEKLTGTGLDNSDRKKLFQKIWFEQFRKGLRKSRMSFKRAGFETNLPARVFGVPLAVLAVREGRQRSGGVPIWAGRFIEYLEVRALKLQGLFRVSGHGDEIAAIRLLIESGEEFHLEARCRDPHSVAALLKLFIRELPESLIPSSLYEQFLEVPNQVDLLARSALLRRLCGQLPTEHRALLSRLLQLLVKVNDNAGENSMGVQNICICWAPNVLRPDEVTRVDVMQGIRDAPLVLGAFKELIERYTELFPPTTFGTASSGQGSSGSGRTSTSGMTSSPSSSLSGSSSSSTSVHPVSPLALYSDSASPSPHDSPLPSPGPRDAADSARRRKLENRQLKVQAVMGTLTEDGQLHVTPALAPAPAPVARIGSPSLEGPHNAITSKKSSDSLALGLVMPPPGMMLPPPPATLPPAPPSPRLLRLDIASLPPPPEPVDEPEASLSRALLGKMMDSFSPRGEEAEDVIDATTVPEPTAPVSAPVSAPVPKRPTAVSPLSFLPKIVPPSASPSSHFAAPSTPTSPPAALLTSPSGTGWQSVKATRTHAAPTLGVSLRRKEEMRDMALIAEASRFIESAGPRIGTPLAPPTAERLFVEVDAFLATAALRAGNSSPSPRKLTSEP